MDGRIQKQVKKRIEWAQEEHRQASTKMYDFSGVQGLLDTPQWREIAQHLADCESHLTNALRRFEQEGQS